jgi:4-hydroxyphenylpyruvate dioxygenase
MQRAQLAINSVSTKQSGLEEALAAYAQAGFRNVEFVLPHVKAYLAQGHSLDAVRYLLQQQQLRAIGGFETSVACFGSREAQQTNHELLLKNAQLIHDLGGGTLVVGTDGPSESVSIEALDTIASTFRTLIRQIEHLHVSIALEFNWSPIVRSLQSAVRVAEQVDHRQFGVLFDPAHYYTTVTKFEHLIPETVRWIKHVHLNDMRNKPGELSHCNNDRVLPGQGILDLHAIIARLEACGYQGLFSIEMFNEGLWALPAATAAAQCYQSLLPLCHE